MKMILPILIVLGIAVFGLVSSTQLISIDLTSFYFETLALIVFNLGGVQDESTSKITLVGDLYYQLIPYYMFKEYIDYQDFKRLGEIKTEKVLLVEDRALERTFSNSKDKEINRLYDNTDTIATVARIVPVYDRSDYPYNSIPFIARIQ
jgi:hypothetical protein